MFAGRTSRRHAARLTGLLGVALIVAACGSSSSSSTSTTRPAAGSSASTTPSSAPAGGVAIGTAKGPGGMTYLTGASGRALYLWVADSNGRSACSGACAKAWPPLLTTAAPTAAGGVMAGDLGTITRSDGTRQVTYGGHPLYYFIADTGAGTIRGQGSDSFGAKWWLVAPSGTAITTGAAAGDAAANDAGSSSSAGSSGSSGGGW